MTWLLFTLAMIIGAGLWLIMAMSGLPGQYGPEWVSWVGYAWCSLSGAWGGFRAGGTLRGH